jgi:carbonic anhydrase
MATKEIPEENGNVMFYQTVPDSHYWTDIDMLIRFLNYQIRTQNTPDIIDYLIMGLENCKKNGYSLSKGEPSPEQGLPTPYQTINVFSPEQDELAKAKQEIERLKGLVINEYKQKIDKIDTSPAVRVQWLRQFKSENNL